MFQLSEQFFFQCFCRQDAAIDFDKRTVCATAGIVNGLRHQVDSRPRLALQEHTSNLIRSLLSLLSQGLHRLTMAHHIAKIPIAELSFESAIFRV